jgi:hypothetical protein
MDESSMSQNRRSRRSNVLLAATLEVSNSEFAVKLRNLSAEGALVEAATLPVEGSQVLFRRNELAVRSRIAWVSGNHAGVAFGTPLKPEEVLRHVPKPRPRVVPDCRRPALSPRDMTAEERRLVETWVWSPTSRPTDG